MKKTYTLYLDCFVVDYYADRDEHTLALCAAELINLFDLIGEDGQLPKEIDVVVSDKPMRNSIAAQVSNMKRGRVRIDRDDTGEFSFVDTYWWVSRTIAEFNKEAGRNGSSTVYAKIRAEV